MKLKAREGEFIETFEGLIFDVKGLVHPPNRIIAFVRYFPDEKGDRERRGKSHGKVYSLSERYALLEERYPRYLMYDPVFEEKMCEVPKEEIKAHHKPDEKLQELRKQEKLDELENRALQLAEQLKEAADIPWSSMGISGSLMVDIYTSDSDIDPVIYGSENCRKAHSALKKLLEDPLNPFQAYTQKGLKELFHFRSKDTHMSYEDFVQTESRKVMQGKFSQKDYFIRFVKDWSEVTEEYGDIRYEKVGYAKVKATVVDDSQALFTPCHYQVGEVECLKGSERPIEEIASFRGRFCDQAREGEEVVAQGKVERVIEDREYFRLLLGNNPSDYMVLA